MFELIIIFYMGKYVKVYLIVVIVREKFLVGYIRSSVGFLLYMEGVLVKVD